MGDSSVLGDHIASEYCVSPIGLDEPPSGNCDGVVIVLGADPAPEPRPIADMTETEWRDAAELMPLRAIRALQHARTATVARCGNIVIITPSVGLTGAGGLIHYVCGIEAIRAMAKSAARQWAVDRISVSLIVVPLGLMVRGIDDLVRHVSGAARKDADLADAVVRAVDFILSGAGPSLTGSTLIVDGGGVMLP